MNDKLKADNRAANLLGTAITALAGFSFASEIGLEDGWAKADDTLLLLLGLFAIFWYRRAQNRFQQTIVPVLFVAGSLVLKLIAIAIEHSDAADVGDDFGGITLFVLATIVVWRVYQNNKRQG